jgi:hypothetical protein
MAETPQAEGTGEVPANGPDPQKPAEPAVPAAPLISAADLKILQDAAAELKTFKDAQLSEQERAAQAKADAESRAAAAEARLAELQATADRARVAAENGLPAFLVDRLKGDTPEEMEADAKALAESLKGTATANLRTKPVATVQGGGAAESNDPGEIDPVKLAAKILARRNG